MSSCISQHLVLDEATRLLESGDGEEPGDGGLTQLAFQRIKQSGVAIATGMMVPQGMRGKAMEIDRGQVTQLLKAMQAGDSKAAENLLPLVYKELHRLAKSYMRRERPDHTLQATALINEAYLRLVREDVDWNSRGHFIGVAAHVMRRVLVDYARAHKAERRAGGLERVEMREELAISPERLDEVALLDEALARLEKHNPRQARVVELRYFGGLSVEEIGALLGIAPRSVKRDWSLARIWLFRELQPGAKDTPAEEK